MGDIVEYEDPEVIIAILRDEQGKENVESDS